MKTCLPLFAVLLLLVFTGCSIGKSSSSEMSDGSLIVKDFAGRQIAFKEPPAKIVALGSGEADIVAALGGNLVGRPTTSAQPVNRAVLEAEQIGNAHEVDLEKIALLRPDVVLGNYPLNEKDIPVLQGIGVQLLLTGANSIEDIKRQIELIGQLLRKEEQAKAIIANIVDKIAVYKHTDVTNKPRVLLVYGAPGTFMAALPNSLSGNILETAGGVNIASDYPRLQSFPQYAQLNAERVVEADPDIIFFMTHGNPEEIKNSFIREMETNSAWSSISAVKQQRIEVLPQDLFGTNPGTRVIEALELMDRLLKEVPN
ncbi:iron-hydroxamate ABC transporter substrate-binding protein [Paenibacillus sp. FSL A5-0031]|uniref:ABC transporter substrate-binding protein n=1 Tax=unclassified Paenibacillus TaxID=185978 RepID=UPI00096FFB12|nr:ABC transporter substrate-binding protein [Paenibacillus sp. FSL A5-0031]OME76448.1 iron-hydroxamate ABC transporter substrate-binding protein [Paenibacillus sp. FSL A5-0031]